jgi:hypothetical protein
MFLARLGDSERNLVSLTLCHIIEERKETFLQQALLVSFSGQQLLVIIHPLLIKNLNKYLNLIIV